MRRLGPPSPLVLYETTGLALGLGTGWLLARPALPTALALFGFLALTVGTLMEPLVGAVGGLFLGLLRAYLRTEAPQVPDQIGHLFLALAFFSHWTRRLARRDLRLPLGARHPAAPLALPALVFLGAAGLSLWSPAYDARYLGPYGLLELVKWAEILLLLWMVAERTDRRHLPWLAVGILAVGVFQALLGLYQFGIRGEGPEHFRIPGTRFFRAYGTFEQPNPYAGYIGMTLALGTGILGTCGLPWISERRWKSVLGIGAAVGLMAVALGASWSRGGWMGFAAALGAMALALPRRSRWGVLLVAGLVVLFLGLLGTGLLPARVVARLTDFVADLRLQDVRGININSANYAVIERLAHWQSAVEMWRFRFWTGVGFGGYEPAYPAFALVNWPIALGHAHNLYLNLLAETGVIGLLAYLALWGAVFYRTWRATRIASGLERGIAVGLLGVWTHLTVHHLVDNLYVNNAHLFIGLSLGMLAAIPLPVNDLRKRRF
ncbi:MAG: O-antigen ligase family protein [Anaerolineae bacterium]|nr:O-antigen ligase family protein [Anaerolineae bacterium]